MFKCKHSRNEKELLGIDDDTPIIKLFKHGRARRPDEGQNGESQGGMLMSPMS